MTTSEQLKHRLMERDDDVVIGIQRSGSMRCYSRTDMACYDDEVIKENMSDMTIFMSFVSFNGTRYMRRDGRDRL